MFTTLVSPGFLAANGEWRVVDCRHDLHAVDAGRVAYDIEHVPGAVHAHLDHDLSGPKTGSNGRHPLPDPAKFCSWLGRAGITPSTPVVAYDEGSGSYAARLWWLMRWVGHVRVCVLDGGWAAWVTQNRARSREIISHAEQIYLGAPRPEWVVTTAEVETNLADKRFLLMDARGTARFAGIAEPIDPVAGHIPGALNRPYTENLQAGRFKPAEVLRDEFETLLQGISPADVVHQCGSGVTACHNLLAMEHAGLHGSKLYAGSWSEWCSDRRRPVARA
jgi:thiosulfate/3-mercaptopyruvate sulfurtransferase